MWGCLLLQEKMSCESAAPEDGSDYPLTAEIPGVDELSGNGVRKDSVDLGNDPLPCTIYAKKSSDHEGVCESRSKNSPSVSSDAHVNRDHVLNQRLGLVSAIDRPDRGRRPGKSTKINQKKQRQITYSDSVDEDLTEQDLNKNTVYTKNKLKNPHGQIIFKTPKRRLSISEAEELSVDQASGVIRRDGAVNTRSTPISSKSVGPLATPNDQELRMEIPIKITKFQLVNGKAARAGRESTELPVSKECWQTNASEDTVTNTVTGGMCAVDRGSCEKVDNLVGCTEKSENKPKPDSVPDWGLNLATSISRHGRDPKPGNLTKLHQKTMVHESFNEDLTKQEDMKKSMVDMARSVKTGTKKSRKRKHSRFFKRIKSSIPAAKKSSIGRIKYVGVNPLNIRSRPTFSPEEVQTGHLGSDRGEEIDYYRDASPDDHSENISKPNNTRKLRAAVKRSSLESNKNMFSADSNRCEVEDLRNTVDKKTCDSQSERKFKPDDSKKLLVAAKCSFPKACDDLSSAGSDSCEEVDYQRDAEDYPKGSDDLSENKSKSNNPKKLGVAIKRSSLESFYNMFSADRDSCEVEDLRNAVDKKKCDAQSERKPKPGDSKKLLVAAKCSIPEACDNSSFADSDSCEEVNNQRDAEDYQKGSDDRSKNKSKPNNPKKCVAINRCSMESFDNMFSAYSGICEVGDLRNAVDKNKCNTQSECKPKLDDSKKLLVAAKWPIPKARGDLSSADSDSCEEVDYQRDAEDYPKGSGDRSENKSKPNNPKKLSVAMKRPCLESFDNMFSADSDSCEVEDLRNAVDENKCNTQSERKPKPGDSKKLLVAFKCSIPETRGDSSSADSDSCEEVDNPREVVERTKKSDNPSENKPNPDSTRKLCVAVKFPFPESSGQKTTVSPKTVQHESSVCFPIPQKNMEVYTTSPNVSNIVNVLGLSPRHSHCQKYLPGSTQSKIVQEAESGSETSSSRSLDYGCVSRFKPSQEEYVGSGIAPVPQYTKESARVCVIGSHCSWTEESYLISKSIWKSFEDIIQSKHTSSTTLHNASSTDDVCRSHTSEISMDGGFQTRHKDKFSMYSDGQHERKDVPHQMIKSPAQNMNWVSHPASSSRQTQPHNEAQNSSTENIRETQNASYNFDIYQSYREDDNWQTYRVNWDEPTFFKNENSFGVYYQDNMSFTKALNWTSKLHGMLKETPVGILKRTPLIEKHINLTAKEVKMFDAIGSALTVTQSTFLVIAGCICPQYWKGESCDKTCKRKHKMNCDEFPSVSPDEVFRVVSGRLMELERPPLEMISSFIQWLTEHNETIKTLSFSKILHTKKGLNVCTTICGIFIKHLSTHFGWQPAAVVEYFLKYHYLMMKGSPHLVGVINRLIAYCQVGTYKHKVYDIVRFLLGVHGYSLPFSIFDKLLHEINSNPPTDIALFKDQIRKQLESTDDCDDLNFRARAYTFLRTYFPESFHPSNKSD